MKPNVRKITLAVLLLGLVLSVGASVNAANASRIEQATGATAYAIIAATCVYALLQLKKAGWW